MSLRPNIIFFDTSKPTDDIWFYEQPSPEGRKNYSKTAPLEYDEMKPCLEWWEAREQNERAWKVYGPDLVSVDETGRVLACNLDLKNPRTQGISDHRTPLEIVESIEAKEERIFAIMSDIKRTLVESK